jgi:hypothetical protein
MKTAEEILEDIKQAVKWNGIYSQNFDTIVLDILNQWQDSITDEFKETLK